MFGRSRVQKALEGMISELGKFAKEMPSGKDSHLANILALNKALAVRGPKLTRKLREVVEALGETDDASREMVKLAIRLAGGVGPVVQMRNALTPVMDLGPEFDPIIHERACDLQAALDEYLNACSD